MLNFTAVPSEYKTPRFLIKLFLLLILLVILPLAVFLAGRVQLFKKEAAEVPVGEKALTPSSDEKPPEHVPGQVLVKFLPEVPKLNVGQAQEAAGVSLDKQAVSFADLDEETLPIALVELNKKYPIKEVEKVFKGVGDPQGDVSGFKTKFPNRAAHVKPEAEEVDLSRTYKLVFEDAHVSIA